MHLPHALDELSMVAHMLLWSFAIYISLYRQYVCQSLKSANVLLWTYNAASFFDEIKLWRSLFAAHHVDDGQSKEGGCKVFIRVKREDWSVRCSARHTLSSQVTCQSFDSEEDFASTKINNCKGAHPLSVLWTSNG